MSLADHITRIHGTLGDINPVDHGGGYVFSRRDNEYSEESPTAELIYIVEPSDERSWDCPECYSGEIDDCDYECRAPHYEGTCDTHSPASCIECKGTGERLSLRWTVYGALLETEEWCDWQGIASYTGMAPEDYQRAFASLDSGPLFPPDYMGVANAICDAASYHGWHEFDQYPDRLTRAEVEALADGMDALIVQRCYRETCERYGTDHNGEHVLTRNPVSSQSDTSASEASK